MMQKLWAWIKDQIAQPDPLDVDSFLGPDTSPPVPDSMFIPGESQRYAIPMPGEEDGRADQDDKR